MTFFKCLFGCPTANFGPLLRGLSHSPDVTTLFYWLPSESHQEPHDEIGSLGPIGVPRVVWTLTQSRGYSSQFFLLCTTQQMQNLTDLHAFTRRKILVVWFFCTIFHIYWFLLAMWCQRRVWPKGPKGMNGFRMKKWHPLWSISVSKLYFWQKNATMIKNIFEKQK